MNETLGLIQAHARGWDGSIDHSLIEVDGKPAVQRTIERLLETSGLTPGRCCLAVPDDRVNDAFLPVAEATGVTLFRGSTHDVALRLLEAVGFERESSAEGDVYALKRTDPGLLWLGRSALADLVAP